MSRTSVSSRMLSLLLALTMAVSLNAPFTAFADEGMAIQDAAGEVTGTSTDAVDAAAGETDVQLLAEGATDGAETAETTDPQQTGYNGATLPEGPDISSDVWTVTPENAQYALDGAYGDITGKTINFSAGEYDTLVLARPTKYNGSGTTYEYNGTTYATYEDYIAAAKTTGLPNYYRTLSDVTLTAEEGATFAGFASSSNHVYTSDSADPQYNYVLDGEVVTSTTNSYYGYSSLSNVTFSGLSFVNGGIAIDAYLDVKNSDIAVENCTFSGSGTTSNDTVAVKCRADSETFENVRVTGCAISNCYQGVYIQGVNGVTISNNVISTTGHNAIALQSSTSNAVSGTVLIEENVVENAQDRAIRFGSVASGASIIIQNNVVLNSGDPNEVMKVQDISSSDVSIDLDNNYWENRSGVVVTADNASSYITSDASSTVSIAGYLPTATGITGGTFSTDVSAYCASGYEATKNADGTYSVAQADIAAVYDADGAKLATYGQLNDALSDAPDGGTVVLLADASMDADVSIDRAIKVDLDGFTLETNGNTIMVAASGNLTVTDGTVSNSVCAESGDRKTVFNVAESGTLAATDVTCTSKSIQFIYAYGTVNIDNSTFDDTATFDEITSAISAGCGFIVNGTAATLNFNSGSLDVTSANKEAAMMYGIYGMNGATLNIGTDGGGASPSITSDYAAIGLNNTTSDNAITINIMSGALTAGTGVDNQWNSVLYLSGYSDVNISGGTITGADQYTHLLSIPYANAGVDLDIDGGTFDATGSQEIIYVVGGTVRESYQHGANSLAISGGSFTGTLAKFVDEGFAGFVSGGTYSEQVAYEYCASGLIPTTADDTTGLYTVEEGIAIASVAPASGDTVYCMTLADVVAAITSAQTATVTVLSDFSLSSALTIVSGMDITLNLNDKTLTFEGNGARLLQNYGTLYVTDSGSAGTIHNVSGTMSYGLIDNYGTLTIDSGTYITNSQGDGAAVKNRASGTLIIAGGTFENTLQETAATSEGWWANATVANNGTLSITGGEFSSSSVMTPVIKQFAGTASISNATVSSTCIIGVEVSGGEATISDSSITVEQEGSRSSYLATAIAADNSGSVTVRSGTTASAPYGAYVFNSGGTIAVEDGSITGSIASLKADDSLSTAPSVIRVTGGSFTGDISIGSSSMLTVSGGQFSAAVDSAYCADGYLPAEASTDGGTSTSYYTVVEAELGFLGGSLRMDKYEDAPAATGYTYDEADLRFGYYFDVPDKDASDVTFWWRYGTASGSLSKTLNGVKYRAATASDKEIAQGKTVANAVFMGIDAVNFNKSIYVEMYIQFTTDGVTYTVGDSEQSRSVDEVADLIIAAGDTESDAHKYATNIKAN